MSVISTTPSSAPLLSAHKMALPAGLKTQSQEGSEPAPYAKGNAAQLDPAVLWGQSPKKQSPFETGSSPQNASKTAAVWQKSEQMLQHSQTMSISLTTREGDEVQLDFRQLFAHYQAEQRSQASQQNNQGTHFFASRQAMEATEFAEKFAFSVEGDLNEAELTAIKDVFAQVGQLATQFYNGDLEQALNQAVEMKVDFSQLSGMQMDLTQTKVMTKTYQQAAAAQYQEVQNSAVKEANLAEQQPGGKVENTARNATDMTQLPVYLQQWQAAIERLDEQFTKARESLNQWVAQVVAQQSTPQGTPQQTAQTNLKPEESAVQTSSPQSSQAWVARMSHFHAQLEQWALKSSPNSPAEKATQEANSPGQAQIDNAESPLASADKPKIDSEQ